MKYVYVLVSSEDDLYYEQCLMSAWSLRFQMPDADIIVLTDNRTAQTFTPEKKRAELEKTVSHIITVDFEDSVGKAERSRLIKTSIPDYVQGDFLYIDCDTVICGDLSFIGEYEYEAAGVLDGHVMLDEHIHKDYFLARDKALGFTGTKAAGFNINGGVILFRDTDYARSLFRAWNEAWKFSAYQKHDLHDQSALNEANVRTGLKMQLLPGEWNCQPSHGGLAFLKDAKIIHYYSSEFAGKYYIPYYKLADKSLQQRIKETGGIPDDIQAMLREPKFQFNKVHLVADKRIQSMLQSPLAFSLFDLKVRLPKLFNLFEKTASAIRNSIKRLKGKK